MMMRLRLSSSLLLLVSMTMTMMLTTSRVVRAFQFFRKDTADDDAHQSPSGNIINLRLRSAQCAACHRVVSQLHTRLLPKIRSQMQLERDRCVGSRDFHVRELFLFSLSLSLFMFLYLFLLGTRVGVRRYARLFLSLVSWYFLSLTFLSANCTDHYQISRQKRPRTARTRCSWKTKLSTRVN